MLRCKVGKTRCINILSFFLNCHKDDLGIFLWCLWQMSNNNNNNNNNNIDNKNDNNNNNDNHNKPCA